MTTTTVSNQYSTTTYAQTGISKQQVKALCSADTVTFSYGSGKHTIRAIKDGRDTRDGFDQVVWVDCGGHITNYGKGAVGECFASARSYDKTVATIWKVLKEGDEINLEWIKNNNSQAMDAAGIVRDELRLEIVRNGEIAYAFIVRVECGEKNQWARMIK